MTGSALWLQKISSLTWISMINGDSIKSLPSPPPCRPPPSPACWPACPVELLKAPCHHPSSPTSVPFCKSPVTKFKTCTYPQCTSHKLLVTKLLRTGTYLQFIWVHQRAWRDLCGMLWYTSLFINKHHRLCNQHPPEIANNEVSLFLTLFSKPFADLPIPPPHLQCGNYCSMFLLELAHPKRSANATMKTSEALTFSNEVLLPQVFLISFLNSEKLGRPIWKVQTEPCTQPNKTIFTASIIVTDLALTFAAADMTMMSRSPSQAALTPLSEEKAGIATISSNHHFLKVGGSALPSSGPWLPSSNCSCWKSG